MSSDPSDDTSPWILLSTRFAPLPDVLLADAGLSIEVSAWEPDPAAFAAAFEAAVANLTAEEVIDIAKFTTRAADSWRETP